MNDIVSRIAENALFLRLSLYVLSDWVLFLFLYLRIESVRSLFERSGLKIDLLIKMIIAALTCLLMTITAIAFNNRPVQIMLSIVLTLASFFLMSHFRVVEIRSEDLRK
ncbi:MAG: hypothetical protein J6S49_07185 [Erysipelotrichaceae bacterium]|nr:hypothetical protein [Erysipelotrichaceae bacterium]MBO7698985.1 hypothetical protein [Erysipelotrichaceae bacterium]